MTRDLNSDLDSLIKCVWVGTIVFFCVGCWVHSRLKCIIIVQTLSACWGCRAFKSMIISTLYLLCIHTVMWTSSLSDIYPCEGRHLFWVVERNSLNIFCWYRWCQKTIGTGVDQSSLCGTRKWPLWLESPCSSTSLPWSKWHQIGLGHHLASLALTKLVILLLMANPQPLAVGVHHMPLIPYHLEFAGVQHFYRFLTI